MSWLATEASVCGARKPVIRTEISLRPDGTNEFGHDLVDRVLMAIMRCPRPWAPAHWQVSGP
jgi:hypothetical protein